MGHRSKTVHVFRCDAEGGCNNRLYITVHAKKYAVKLLRRSGWSAISTTEFYCHDHNTKPKPDDDLPYQVEEDRSRVAIV